VVTDLVLAALSASPTRRPVLGFAKLFAAMYGSDVSAIHVAEPHHANTVGEFAFGEHVGLRVVDGDPVREIVRAASHPNVGLVVIGAHNPPNGRGPGLVTREIALRVRQPLLVVPAQAIVPDRLACVLVPLEGTETTTAPIRALFERLPFGPDTELVTLRSYTEGNVPRYADHEPHDTDERIHAFRDGYIPPGVIGRVLERYGPPEHVVPKIAAMLDATLTVVSWSQTLAPGRALLIKALLADPDRPTLLVPDRYQPPVCGFEHANHTPDRQTMVGHALNLEVGACRNFDPDVFRPDPDSPQAVARARTICARCDVRLECLAFALRTEHLDGIWGGLTETERARYITADFASVMRRG